MRERVILISVNFGLTAILMLSLYFLGLKDTNAAEDKTEINKRFDKKVDKTVYEAYVGQNEKEHQEMKKVSKEGLEELKEHINTRFEDFKEFMKELAKQ